MADETVPLVPIVPMDKTVEALMGFIKANTSDILGAPADIAHGVSKVLSRNSEPAPPSYGSDYFRKVFFGADQVETKSMTEVAGSLVSPGGVASAGKAMIVGAIPKLAFSGVSAKSAARIMTEVERLQTSDDAIKFFQATGVFKTEPGALKAAISDSSATLKPTNFSRIPDTEGKLSTVLSKDTQLGEILDHPELYKMYPGLAGIKVKSDPKMAKNDAVFNRKTQEITLGPMESGDKMFSRVLHETQHAVQDIEGFKVGTTPEAQAKGWATFDSRLAKDLQYRRDAGDPQAQRLIDEINLRRDEAFKKYSSHPGESEARFTESTRNSSQRALDVRIEEVLRNPLPVSFWDK